MSRVPDSADCSILGRLVGARVGKAERKDVAEKGEMISTTEMSTLVAETRRLVAEATKERRPDWGEWFCRSGSCITFSYQLREALIDIGVSDTNQKLKGPHSYLSRQLKNGKRIVIDPTWKQLFVESDTSDLPDILVASEEGLSNTLHQLAARGARLRSDWARKYQELNEQTIKDILVDVYDFPAQEN